MRRLGKKVLKRARGKHSVHKGKVGERKATKITGVEQNKEKFEVNGRKRIPDQVNELNDKGKPTFVTEVKNTKQLSLTKQLKDDIDLVGKGG